MNDYKIIDVISTWIDEVLNQREKEFSAYRVAARYENFKNACHSLSNHILRTMGIFGDGWVTSYRNGVLEVFWHNEKIVTVQNDEITYKRTKKHKFNKNHLEMYLLEFYRECVEMDSEDCTAKLPISSDVIVEIDQNGFVYVIKSVGESKVKIVASNGNFGTLVYGEDAKYYLVSKETMTRFLKRLQVFEKTLPVYLHQFYEDYFGNYQVATPIIGDYYIPTCLMMDKKGEIPNKKKVEILDEEFFEIYNGVKIIKEQYRNNTVLRLLNLSLLSFKRADIRGIDFSGTNYFPDIQEVWNKDASGCSFEGIMMPFTNLSGCIMDDCNLIGTYANLREVKSVRNIIVDDTVVLGETCTVKQEEMPQQLLWKMDQ